MESVAEPATRRRSWPWRVLVVGVLLCGAWLAWRHRPLNRTEKVLIGTWRRADIADYHCVYQADRTFVCFDPTIREPEVREFNTLTGSWRAWDGELRERPNLSPWEMTSWQLLTTDPLRWCQRTCREIPLHLRVEAPDRIWINDQKFLRVAEPPANDAG